MKNIAKLFVLTAGVMSMASCSDFLDQDSPSEQTTSVVYESPYYTGLVVNKIYGGLTQDQTYSQYIPIVWGANSDCELIDGLGNDASNTSSERGNMNYNSNPGWANLAKLWDAMYGVIEYCNSVIAGVENSNLAKSGTSDGKEMLRYKGEALTIRAMLYHDLVRFFGDVPMKLEPSNSDLNNVYLPKTDRDSIMSHMILDLEEAIGYLPWAGDKMSTEHVTQGYAHALLANIALTRSGWAIREAAKEGYVTAENSDATYPTQRMGDADRKAMYELALTHLSAVINSGVHKLNPSFKDEWYKLNQLTLDTDYRENIFEIPMGLGVSGELGYTAGIRINGASARYGQKGNSSGKLKVTAPLFWSYDKNDTRRDVTCGIVQLKEEDFSYNTGASTLSVEGKIHETTIGNAPFAIYCGKWDVRMMSERWRETAIATGNAKWMTGINCVRMRYSQVLLMYAEVLNELAGPDATYGAAALTARQALAEVHNRAFDAAAKVGAQNYIDALTAANFFNAIVDENMWELAGEGVRKFDLIRWNLLSDKIDQMKADYTAQISEYPAKIYFKRNTSVDNCPIDMSTVTWYLNMTSSEASDMGYMVENGWESATFFGAELTDANQKNLTINLPSISSGLNAEVKNRYIMPIGSTTISASNGMLHNSYGFKD